MQPIEDCFLLHSAPGVLIIASLVLGQMPDGGGTQRWHTAVAHSGGTRSGTGSGTGSGMVGGTGGGTGGGMVGGTTGTGGGTGGGTQRWHTAVAHTVYQSPCPCGACDVTGPWGPWERGPGLLQGGAIGTGPWEQCTAVIVKGKHLTRT